MLVVLSLTRGLLSSKSRNERDFPTWLSTYHCACAGRLQARQTTIRTAVSCAGRVTNLPEDSASIRQPGYSARQTHHPQEARQDREPSDRHPQRKSSCELRGQEEQRQSKRRKRIASEDRAVSTR